MGDKKWKPPGMTDRPAEQWLGEAELCKQLIVELAEREIASLTQREAILREQHETPARNSAEVRKQVLASPLGMHLVRLIETHQRQYDRAFSAFQKGRAQSAKSGVLPGAPHPDLHGEAWDPRGWEPEPTSRVGSAETQRQQRKQAADEVAPSPENGIGPPIADSDRQRAAVLASEHLAENHEAHQAADAAFTALAWPSAAMNEACAASVFGG